MPAQARATPLQVPGTGDAIAGFALAATLAAWPRPLAGLLAADYTIADIGALLISLTVGLFGFYESIQASFVTESLAIEAITVAARDALYRNLQSGNGSAGPQDATARGAEVVGSGYHRDAGEWHG